MSDPRNLTGVWYGAWTATHPVYPNSFIAHLVEAHGQVSGSITEPDLHRRPAIFRAFVEGARAGPEVRFVKQYDGSGRLLHAVLYTGRINDTGTETDAQYQLELVKIHTEKTTSKSESAKSLARTTKRASLK